MRFLFLFAIFVSVTANLRAQSPPRVVCFGDSITNRGYPKILGELLDVEAINAGVGGNTTSKALRRMEADVLSKSPAVVVIFFGTNDLRVDNQSVHVPLAKYKANLEKMVSACQKQQAHVVVCTLPPIDPTPFYTRHERGPFEAAGGLAGLIEGYRRTAVEVANSNNVSFVDLQKILTEEPQWMSPDGVHPSDEGNKIIAKYVARAVEPLLVKRRPGEKADSEQIEGGSVDSVERSTDRLRLPNIILLMSDDQGWGDVGFNGNEDLKTPHLDAMAENGVRFDRFYAAAPLCSPTRGSCLTGRFPFRFGILAAHTSGLRVGEITIAEMLKKKDYATGFFGKWHIGWVKPDDVSTRGHYSPPSHHGFQEVFATTSAVPTWNPTVTPEGWKSNTNKPGEPWKGGFPYMHNGKEATENLDGDDSRVIMDRVIPFVEQNKDERFFATVWFHTPHEPVVAGEEYKKPYAKFGKLRQNYYGCITAMDEQIGRLRRKLRELGVEKNTLIFFCSDNGPGDSLAKKRVASAGPFKGHKHQMYEGGVLVPACAEWPGVIQPGSATEVRCSTVDYFPTIANIVDYKFSSKHMRPIDGIDLMPVINGVVTHREKELFFGFRRLHDGTDGKSIISGNYKLLREAKDTGQTRLYDLSRDPYERNDLSGQMPELFETLTQRLAALEASCQLSRDGADYSY